MIGTLTLTSTEGVVLTFANEVPVLTLSAPDNNATLTYTGVSGPKGDTGATGPQGPAGPEGETIIPAYIDGGNF